jgi:hypothetical protein
MGYLKAKPIWNFAHSWEKVYIFEIKQKFIPNWLYELYESSRRKPGWRFTAGAQWRSHIEIHRYKKEWIQIWSHRRPRLRIRKHRDLQEWLRDKRSLHESKAFSTCPSSEKNRWTICRSPLVRMLPQLVCYFSVERACVKPDVFFKF